MGKKQLQRCADNFLDQWACIEIVRLYWLGKSMYWDCKTVLTWKEHVLRL